MGLRTIKFRGKRIDNGKWVYANLRGLGIDMFNECVNEDTIGQFTGLFDKNGKEIYEGDILNNGQRNYFVCWNSERGAWWLKNKDLIYTTPLGFLSIELFVVGNIYDNPDLIKEE